MKTFAWPTVLLCVLVFSSCTSYEIRQLPRDQKFEAGRTHLNMPDQGERWGVYQRGQLIPEYTQAKDRDFVSSEEEAVQLLKQRKKKLSPLIKEKYPFQPRPPLYYLGGACLFVISPVVDLIVVPLIYSLDYMANRESKTVQTSKSAALGGNFMGLSEERLPAIWFPMTRTISRELFFGPTGWMGFSGIPEPKKEWEQNEKRQRELKALMSGYGTN